MRSHRLLRLDDSKSAASCQQASCKLIAQSVLRRIILSTGKLKLFHINSDIRGISKTLVQRSAGVLDA